MQITILANTGSMMTIYGCIKESLPLVNIVNIFIFAVLGIIVAALNYAIYKGYKKSLLHFQTFILRYQCTPLGYAWNKCNAIFAKIKLFIAGKDQQKAPWRQSKGLVGVIAIDMKTVAAPTIQSGMNLQDIYFVDKDGDYDNRNTHLPDHEIDAECKKIEKYYDDLKEKLKEFGSNPIFQYEKFEGETITCEHLCDCFKRIYSPENIKKAIEKTNKEIQSNNAVHFIGDKIGVCGYDLSKGNLTMDIYRTDHFTWQVFKEIFKAEKPFFQEVILRVNKATAIEKKYLVKLLAFLFSSFGIDIIIEGLDCRNKRRIIITARSGKIEKDGKGSLHVSVNETFSRTDSIENKEKYSLIECVRRGIEEEMGIPQTLITEDIIRFHDFAIVTDEGEIGLSCHVNLSDVMPVEKMMMYPGQDKFLENEELIMLPYFKISHLELIKSVDSAKFMRSFYINTMHDRFSMPWMSFTPLLISRVMIRNIRFSIPAQIIVRTVLWAICFMIMAVIYNPTLLSVLVIEQIIGTIPPLVVEAVWVKVKRKSSNPYKFLQPAVAQWYGNAKVVQASGVTHHGAEVIRKGLSFDLSNIATSVPVKVSELELSESPYCSVRRKKSKGTYTEVPISSYKFGAHNPKAEKNTLHFLSTNIWSDTNDTIIDIKFEFKLDEILGERKIVRISFIDEVDVTINNIDAPTEGLKDYELMDLFTYKENYYWSCVGGLKSRANDFIISDKAMTGYEPVKNFYDHVLKIVKSRTEKKGSVTFRIMGPSQVIEQWLCSFTSHRENKRRISELELYMLQFYFIRHDKIFADCEFKDRIRYKIYAGMVTP